MNYAARLIPILLFSFLCLTVSAQEDLEKYTISFEEAKGSLSCPTADGSLDASRLYIESDLSTSAGMDVLANVPDVLAIHEGIVVSAIAMGELGVTLIVSHGDYFSVFTDLEEATVTSKDKVSAGDLIGKSMAGETSEYKFHIEIWKDTEKLFPGAWISCE